jgi:hypothetical protein
MSEMLVVVERDGVGRDELLHSVLASLVGVACRKE